jgi:hypothetical protein
MKLTVSSARVAGLGTSTSVAAEVSSLVSSADGSVVVGALTGDVADLSALVALRSLTLSAVSSLTLGGGLAALAGKVT